MPQSRERKREYMRRYMAKRRSGDGDRSGKGVSPPTRRRDLLVPMNPWTMTKRQLVEYLAYAGERGYTLVWVTDHYALIPTYEKSPSYQLLLSRVEVLEKRNTQAEADLARLEVMIDSMMAEDSRDGLP